jgi:hypothetical protein
MTVEEFASAVLQARTCLRRFDGRLCDEDTVERIAVKRRQLRSSQCVLPT